MDKWGGTMNQLIKVLTGVALSALFAFKASYAEEKKPETTAQYLERLQTRLDHAARRGNQPTSEGSSVVGLRGSKQEASNKQLYWKGKKGKVAVAPEELRSYRAAVEEARGGKNTEAIASLKAFQEKYPNSALRPDVDETLKRLSE
jgi:TolA-binding protein